MFFSCFAKTKKPKKNPPQINLNVKAAVLNDL